MPPCSSPDLAEGRLGDVLPSRDNVTTLSCTASKTVTPTGRTAPAHGAALRPKTSSSSPRSPNSPTNGSFDERASMSACPSCAAHRHARAKALANDREIVLTPKSSVSNSECTACVSNPGPIVPGRDKHASTESLGRGNGLGAERGKSGLFVCKLAHPPSEFSHCQNGDGFRQCDEPSDHRRTFLA